MCLAIVKPENRTIPEEHLRRGFAENPHGAGFAVAHRGRMRIRKGFFTIEDFLRAWRKVSHHPALVHFRWATAGMVDARNCHPWQVHPTLALIHNGHLPVAHTPEMSDTGHFVEMLRSDAHRLDDVGFRADLGKWIGPGNKLALMDRHGAFTIINEGQGHWLDGVWYSNYGYAPSAYAGWNDYDFRCGDDADDLPSLADELARDNQLGALHAYDLTMIEDWIIRNDVPIDRESVEWAMYDLGYFEESYR